ncbi:methylmalonyl-CoA mutase [Zhengella mangrovi]|uniref:Methylmalonyl-CoA mutase n=1 Tax=Zhengella mangrovi TaxID=1982044 RepID=A0A2G1QI07_9HYPH|nr:methylmalonyl-CoA mutase [Zhengella mangrovi]
MDAAVLKQVSFDALGMDHWRQLAEKALKGADYENTLVSHSDDGIRIDPLSPPATPRLVTGAHGGQPWTMVQRVDDPDTERATRQIAEDLDGGANGLALVFEGAPNAFGYGLTASPDTLAAVLDAVPLDQTHLRIDVHPSSRNSLDWMVALLMKKRVNPASLSLSFGIDPAAIFAGTGRLRMSIAALRASMPQSLAHFFAMQVPGVLLEADGRVYHNAGATEAQELAAMLSLAAGHMRMFEEARQPLVYAAPHIGFCVSADSDQFMTMAKIRALRLLWTRLQEACGIEPSATSIHAETSFRMLTRRDAETNLLRNTIACFSAAVGGADTISVLPHSFAHGLPDDFARRLARNTQLVLAQESRLWFVADPASGSGAIETLTDRLCEAAWTEFQAIEAEGGILQSLLDGAFQVRVKAAAEVRAKAYRDGERVLVGSTIYPPGDDRPVTTWQAERRPMPTDGSVRCERLDITRIEQMAGGAS